jgi:hypothetical protein
VSNVFFRACKSKNNACKLSDFVEKMMVLGKKLEIMVRNEDKITSPLTDKKDHFGFIFAIYD